MNSEIKESYSLLKSISYLEQLTSFFSSQETESIFKEITQKPVQSISVTGNETNKDNNDTKKTSLTNLLKLSSTVEPQNEFYIRNLYANILTSQPEDYSFSMPASNDYDFKLNKVTISVSNSLSEEEDVQQVEQVLDNSPQVKQTRRRLNNTVKSLLERIFIAHPSPNRKERELIAKKCGVSPLQIRVWFTNKRMRQKQQTHNDDDSKYGD